MPLTGPQKAIVAFIITVLTGIGEVLITSLPDNGDVQLYGAIAVAILGVIATSVGVHQVPNVPLGAPAATPPVAVHVYPDAVGTEHSQTALGAPIAEPVTPTPIPVKRSHSKKTTAPPPTT